MGSHGDPLADRWVPGRPSRSLAVVPAADPVSIPVALFLRIWSRDLIGGVSCWLVPVAHELRLSGRRYLPTEFPALARVWSPWLFTCRFLPVPVAGPCSSASGPRGCPSRVSLWGRPRRTSLAARGGWGRCPPPGSSPVTPLAPIRCAVDALPVIAFAVIGTRRLAISDNCRALLWRYVERPWSEQVR